MEINLFDDNGLGVSHIVGYSLKSKHVTYVKNLNKYNGITIFTDKTIVRDDVEKVSSKIKVAWLLEPKVVYGVVYEKIIKYEDKYDYILTYDSKLLKRSSKYIFAPASSTWIPEEFQKIYDKSKKVSMILSSKRHLVGRKLRYEIYDGIKEGIDYYGNECNYIRTKDLGLRDYMYSIAVENCSVENYFTEKLIDCFLCGTVPVYWGCSNIDKFFDINGIVSIKDVDDLKEKLVHFNIHNYKFSLPYIRNNFNTAQKYKIIDDYVYENFLSKL